MPEWRVPGYTQLKTLGSGGFGDVVLARHDATGILVAVKYLHRDLLADREFTAMFREEAQLLAFLDDPNVVRLYEYVESPDGAAIVMELISGVSLREILAYQGKTSAEAALAVLHGSLLGLAAAHRRGVVHRDYKPENVLVNGDGVSKLTDFGIAARTGDLPVPAGTMQYAAPEQLAGAQATPASDVYAATATFYECLTGRPPFTGEPADLLRQHRSEPVPLDPVPGPLRPLVASGMAKDPRHRPADAITFVTELNTAASGAYGRDWEKRGRSHLGEAALALAALWPSGAPPTTQATTMERIPLRRFPRLRRIGPVRAIIAAGAVIAAAAAAGTALAATRSPRPAPPHQPLAVVQSVSLHPSPSVSPTPPVTTPPVTTPPVTTPPVTTPPVTTPPVTTPPVSVPVPSSPADAYARAVMADGPVAYWQFSGGAGSGGYADSSGNGNTLPAGATTSASPGALSAAGAISTAGGGTYTTTSLSPLAGDAPRTVEAWFRTTATGCIFSTGQGAHAQAFSLCLRNGPVNAPTPGAPGFYFETYDADVFIPIGNLTDGTWHYLAATLTGDTVNIVIDSAQPSGYIWNGNPGVTGGGGYGELTAQPFTLPYTPDTAAAPLGVATAGIGGIGGGLSGAIAEVAVYPSALPVSDLVSHYQLLAG